MKPLSKPPSRAQSISARCVLKIPFFRYSKSNSIVSSTRVLHTRNRPYCHSSVSSADMKVVTFLSVTFPFLLGMATCFPGVLGGEVGNTSEEPTNESLPVPDRLFSCDQIADGMSDAIHSFDVVHTIICEEPRVRRCLKTSPEIAVSCRCEAGCADYRFTILVENNFDVGDAGCLHFIGD